MRRIFSNILLFVDDGIQSIYLFHGVSWMLCKIHVNRFSRNFFWFRQKNRYLFPFVLVSGMYRMGKQMFALHTCMSVILYKNVYVEGTGYINKLLTWQRAGLSPVSHAIFHILSIWFLFVFVIVIVDVIQFGFLLFLAMVSMPLFRVYPISF